MIVAERKKIPELVEILKRHKKILVDKAWVVKKRTIQRIADHS